MGKRISSLSPDQLGFSFEAPRPASQEAGLAGLDRMVSAGIARALKEDPRSRPVIAGKVSELLDEEVTKMMLDAYASEAREKFNVPLHRGFAIIAVTDRYDILDAWLRRIGACILIGEELYTAELGSIDRQIDALKKRRKDLAASARPIERTRR